MKPEDYLKHGTGGAPQPQIPPEVLLEVGRQAGIKQALQMVEAQKPKGFRAALAQSVQQTTTEIGTALGAELGREFREGFAQWASGNAPDIPPFINFGEEVQGVKDTATRVRHGASQAGHYTTEGAKKGASVANKVAHAFIGWVEMEMGRRGGSQSSDQTTPPDNEIIEGQFRDPRDQGE
ncbi:hypothetical protein A3A66_02770 [Microgenomates group bacterium RIFCSPLOWO2_01_FULL_46_13]|nr:MAG: hypothetical protein A2783_00135 [Microgenomates group bacterium RIFCSPHIGHO2_01_FULL_45_11]OGV94890.1 MAG: hypothetical protein A3A66_02770 [Microgenomates group bacterium RIFCSPLOWO2_01_FULL_46_13]